MDTVAGMRIFAGVVESGSFSAAGRQVGLAPSSVSRRIGDLEDELGARLFHRTTRKLSLTEAGQIYFERAARILIEVDEAKLAVARSDGAPSGVLRLTAPASVARRHIVPALGDFQARYPAVQIVLSISDRLVDLVEDRFDLAIRLGAQSDSSLIARKIGSGRRFVVASPAYLDRAGVPGTPAELADHNCLTFRSHRGSNLWRFRGGQGESQVRVTGSLFSDNGEALCAAAVSGLGLILVPEWLTGIEVKHGRLRELLSGWRALPEVTPLYAVYPHQRHLPAKVRSFIDFLVQRFAAQSGWDGGT